jgi:hypothetical protein
MLSSVSDILINTGTLNESGYVEDTLAAIKGRTIHMYHTEGLEMDMHQISSRLGTPIACLLPHDGFRQPRYGPDWFR